MFRLIECFVNKKLPSPEIVYGTSCKQGYQFMFRLIECLLTETFLSPETQVTKVSNTCHQLKKKCSFEGPVFHL